MAPKTNTTGGRRRWGLTTCSEVLREKVFLLLISTPGLTGCKLHQLMSLASLVNKIWTIWCLLVDLFKFIKYLVILPWNNRTVILCIIFLLTHQDFISGSVKCFRPPVEITMKNNTTQNKKDKSYLLVQFCLVCCFVISSKARTGLQNSCPLFLIILCFIAVRLLHSRTNLKIWQKMK
jgi:hypothetical protein